MTVDRQQIFAQEGQEECFIISFPKSGRTWLRFLLGSYLQKAYGLRNDSIIAGQTLCPAEIEFPVATFWHEDDPFWQTPEKLNSSKEALSGYRVVFLIRDPRDVLVSSYFEKCKRGGLHGLPNYQGTLGDFLSERVGSLETILRYYQIWYQNRRTPKGFHLVSYEGLQDDTFGALKSLLQFLGGEKCNNIDEMLIQEAVDANRFEKMRQMESRNQYSSSYRLRPGDFKDPESFKVRKGQVGGYKEYFSVAQIQFIEDRMRQELPKELACLWLSSKE